VVEVHFTRKWKSGGQPEEKKGKEWIHVLPNGRIGHIYV